MKATRLGVLSVALGLCLSGCKEQKSGDVRAGVIEVVDARFMPDRPLNKKDGFIMLEIHNPGRHADLLVGASSPAGRIQIIKQRLSYDLYGELPIPSLDIPAQDTVGLAWKGTVLMLRDYDLNPAGDSTFPITLEFRWAGPVTVDVELDPGMFHEIGED